VTANDNDMADGALALSGVRPLTRPVLHAARPGIALLDVACSVSS
jgi:hypothetical protein